MVTGAEFAEVEAEFKVYYSDITVNRVRFDPLAEYLAWTETKTRLDFNDWLIDKLADEIGESGDIDTWSGSLEITEVELPGDEPLISDELLADIRAALDPDEQPPRPGPGQLDIFGHQIPFN